MNSTTNTLIALLSIVALTVGCMALGAKKAAQQTNSEHLSWDTIPPIVSQKKINQDGMDYNIDTTKCRLSPDQFIQRYPKWLNLDQNNTLKIDTLYDNNIPKEKRGHAWSYTYRHHFKGVPVGLSTTFFETNNNIVVRVSDWRKQVPDTVDVSVNFSPEQVRKMVADIIRKEGVADTVAVDAWAPGRKVSPADFIQKDSIIATIDKAIIGMYNETWQLVYGLTVWFSDDGDIIADRAIYYKIDPKTGKIISQYAYRPGTSEVNYTCTLPCFDDVGIGGSLATYANQDLCEGPPLALYDACGNTFNELSPVNLSIPTIGHKAASCPSGGFGTYDDFLTCRNVAITRQQTCNATEYNYALYRTSSPGIHAYQYQPAMGLESNLYEGDHFKFPNKSDYVFTKNVLSATSAYWALDLAQQYFVEKNVNGYDGLGSPIEVVVGRPDVRAQWTQFITFPGTLTPPAFTKQIYLGNIVDDPDFEYSKPNVLIHEYTHAALANHFQVHGNNHVVNFTSPELPSDLAIAETDALHEGLSDIFAILIMEQARQDEIVCNNSAAQADRWLMPIDQVLSRRLDNPALTINAFGIGQATYYGSDSYNAIVTDPLYSTYLPYYRAGLVAYWFYLATEGSTEPIGNISGICGLGIETMTKVLLATLQKCKAENANDGYTPTFQQFCSKSIEAIDEMTSIPYGERCDIRRCVLRAWKAVGLGLTIPGGKTDDTQDETLCFVDLRMRDNAWDTGMEPNYSAGVDADGDGWSLTSPTDWEDIWASPDLWNCDDTENCPVTDWHNPRATIPNRLGFTIYNAHPDLISDPAQLHLYYSLANTGEFWAYDWVDNHYQNPSSAWCYVGDEIVNSPVEIPSLDPQTYYTGWAGWSPPNFVNPDYSFYADPVACGLDPETDPADDELKYEICLLARLVSAADPIVGESDAPIRDNVFNSNNIVTRNTFLVDPAAGPGGGLPPIVSGHPSVILVMNSNDEARNLDVLFDKISAGSVEALNTLIEISWILSPDLWAKWESTGKQGQGVQEIGDREVKITNMETAKLLNIPFDAREFQPLAIKVTILTNSGKREEIANLPAEFGFRITHQSSNGSPINKPSNCLFMVKDIPSRSQSAQLLSEQLVCAPNPFSSSMNIRFYIDKDQTASLALYDLQGKLVKTVLNEQMLSQGEHNIGLESGNLANGIYICSLITANKRVHQKVVLLR